MNEIKGNQRFITTFVCDYVKIENTFLSLAFVLLPNNVRTVAKLLAMTKYSSSCFPLHFILDYGHPTLCSRLSTRTAQLRSK